MSPAQFSFTGDFAVLQGATWRQSLTWYQGGGEGSSLARVTGKPAADSWDLLLPDGSTLAAVPSSDPTDWSPGDWVYVSPVLGVQTITGAAVPVDLSNISEVVMQWRSAHGQTPIFSLTKTGGDITLPGSGRMEFEIARATTAAAKKGTYKVDVLLVYADDRSDFLLEGAGQVRETISEAA